MASEEIDDLALMAYADGEADAATVARIELALRTDAGLARRLARFADSRAAVRNAFATLPPVPDRLVAGIRSAAAPEGRVVPLRRRPAAWVPASLAAGLALAVGLGAGWYAGHQPGPGELHIAALDDPQLLVALAALPSGESREMPGGARVTPIASYIDGAGALCREVEHVRPGGETLVAVACLQPDGWRVPLAVAAGPDVGYAPASALETLDAWLASTEAGAPMAPEAEAAALATLSAQPRSTE